ncbi:MAG: hypothetical protein FJ030_18165 [Chloroflexi bacterium]|nr:hypothetical protein [Chloroflexota bacterium]
MTISPIPIKLPLQEWERILRLGADGRARELEEELARAEQAIAKFEKRFGSSFAKVEETGLSAGADFEAHEAYIEWHSWEARRADLRKRLTALHSLESPHGD